MITASSIDKAFARGDNQAGLELIRELNASTQATPASLNRQAVIEEQIGDWALAGIAHHRCILAAPQLAVSYLYAGYWLQQSQQTDAAAAAYSLAQEVDPSLLNVVRDGNNAQPDAATETPQRLRAFAATQLLRSYLTEQHQSALKQNVNAGPVADSLWVQTHLPIFSSPNSNYQPQLFYLPGLQQQRYYATSEFDWAQKLSDQSNQIRDELVHALNTSDALRPYLESPNLVPQNLRSLAGSNNWSALDLYKNGQENPLTKTLFTDTLAAIAEVPTYGLNSTPFEVFFSILKPGQSIASHFGQSNHTLTVHLALDIPDNCYLEVAGEKRTWREGELLVFDDNFLHSAHNGSAQQRIVLIFSVWHPQLTAHEQSAILDCFKTRQQWMASRREKLQALLSV